MSHKKTNDELKLLNEHNDQDNKPHCEDMVIISEPTSPVDDMDALKPPDTENGGVPEEDDGYSLTGSEFPGMTHEFDYSTLSLNFPQDAGVAAAQELLPVPPDGGYGWIIVIAAFFSNLIVDGVCTCFTEYKDSYKEHFKSTDATTALIGSLLIGSYLLVGPMVGGLVNKYGARAIVITGSIISGVAFLISVAAPNIYIFMIIYGVIGGIGFGMIYLPAIVVVGYYFESKRAIATGISVAGSGVGTIVMPFLSEYFIRSFGWDKAVWMMAILTISCSLFGLLYRPLLPPVLDDTPKDVELEPLKEALSKMDEYDENRAASQLSNNDVDSPSKRSQSAVSKQDGDALNDPALARLRNALSECEEEGNGQTAQKTTAPLSPITENTISKSRTGSQHQSQRPRKLTLTSMNSDMTSNNALNTSRTALNGNQLSRVSARSYAQSLSRLSKSGQSTLSIAMSGVDAQEFARPFNRQDILYAGSVTKLNEYKKEGGDIQNYRSSVLSIPRSVIGQAVAASQANLNELGIAGSKMTGSRMSHVTGGLVDEDIDDMDAYYDQGRCKFIPLAIRNAFSEMIDVELLKDPIMLLLCVSNLLGMMGFYIPFVFLKDLALGKNVDAANAMYLVPIIGVTNTVGRVFFGWLSDRGYVTALAINNFSLLSCGVLCAIAPLCTGFTSLVVYASLFGFIISAYICLTSIVLADLLGLEKLTNSFGLLVVFRGVASLAGSPFAGLVYDITKSYDMCFYFAGGVIAVSGLISCIIPLIHRWRRSHGENEGEYAKEADFPDNMSGKLSVLTERSEENLTEYQRTIQSLRQQHALLQEMEEERRRLQRETNKNHIPEAEEDLDEHDARTTLIQAD